MVIVRKGKGKREKGKGKAPAARARREAAERERAGVGPREQSEKQTSQYNQVMAKVVAIIGASSNRNKFGNRALRAYARQGFTVLAINPNEKEVEGHRTYASVLDVPGPIDMATVYVPGHIGVRVMEQLAQKGISEVWLNPGADTEEVVAEARKLGLNTIQACSIMAIGEPPY
jgi:predicted CoA-binding protein